jgi:hypothetical protein
VAVLRSCRGGLSFLDVLRTADALGARVAACGGPHGPPRRGRDNDRTGYTSKKGKAAEEAAGLTVLPLPKRRPDLQPLDYTFHSAVEGVLRAEEATWDASKVETRAEFETRLLAAYASLSEERIREGCAAMKKRLQQVVDAKGGHIKRD